MIRPESATLWLIGGVLAVLGVATVVGWWLKRRLDTGLDPAIVRQFHLRLRMYWLVSTVLAMSLFWLGQIATVVLFGFLSFWALREFITLTPTRRADHRGLFWAFFIFTPLQYILVAVNWHEVYSVLIPGFAFLFLAARVAFAGDTKRFLERTAKTQAGLMLCVYCLSYAPALLTQELALPKAEPAALPKVIAPTAEPPGPSEPAVPNGSPSPFVSEAGTKPPTGLDGQERGDAERSASPPTTPDEATTEVVRAEQPTQDSQKARLLFFLVLIAQLSDIMQYLWGKVFPGRVIAPEVNPTKTWGGYLGGIVSGAVLGGLLWWAIAPPPESLQNGYTYDEISTYFAAAALLSAVVAAAGLAGGLTMSAIKRDRGVKDFGTLVVGHGGVLDRIDSLCFAAPVFFYLTRILLWLDANPIDPWAWLRGLWPW